MDDLLSMKYGIAGICVLLTIYILMRVGEFVWSLREKRDSSNELAIEKLTVAVQENTLSVGKIELRLEKVEGILGELPKLQKDLMRYFTAVKIVSGDKWPEVRRQIMEADIP